MTDFSAFVGTRPVAEAHAFDVDRLSDWLREHLSDFAGPLQVEMFKGGQSNPTYKLLTPQRSYVMRAKPGPVAKLLPSAHAIEREYRVMKALEGTPVPVARMLALCEDEAVIGRAFYVMEFVDGRVLWDQSLPGMTPAQRGEIYDEMNRVIAALHCVDPAAVGLGQMKTMLDTPIEQQLAAGMIFAIPPVIFYIVMQRYIVAGITAGAVKG